MWGCDMDVTIHPVRGRLHGRLEAISSKSDVHRALILAALADGETQISCNLLSKDMEATARCLHALGADIRYDAGKKQFLVRPIPNFWEAAVGSGAQETAVVLDCGESGSTLRFLLPVAAALGRHVTFTGSGRLPQRPVGVLLQELERHGVKTDGEKLPLTISGRLQAGEYTLPGNVSSQFVTGLLLAFPLLDAPASLRLSSPLESRDYVEVTRTAMAGFGCQIEETDWGYRLAERRQMTGDRQTAGNKTAGNMQTAASDRPLAPGKRFTAYHSPGRYEADGDWSNAAFFLCAEALSKQRFQAVSEETEEAEGVAVTGLSAASPQADKRIVAVLREAEQAGSFRFDASEAPDLVPALAAFAAFLPGISEIVHAKRLRLKECDRLAAMTETLNALGAQVLEHPDGLAICGKKVLPGGVTVSGWNDHRVVMALSIAACFCEAPVRIRGAEAVQKSEPDFFEALRALGGVIDGI